MITGRATLAGVLGWPVAHSRSPRLHNHWIAQHGIDGAYLPLPVRPTSLATAIAGLRAAGFVGANVTIPHKETVTALCDTLANSARQAGAVNTLVFDGAGMHGSNTDGAGFLANLAAHAVPATGPALLLGAGGAARAIAAALVGEGARVSIANRTPERAHALRQFIPGLRFVDWHDRSRAVADHQLLVNTTTLGMHSQPALDIDLSAAPPNLAVADIVYVPIRTNLLVQAERFGLRTVPGLGMLLHQAVPGFARWFGVTPLVDQQVHDLVAADIQP